MAYKFNDEDKVVEDMAERMPFGVNTVRLVGATAGETEAGKDYIELAVENEAGLTETARVWFVGKASPYSFATLRQIIVHNADDKHKEEARLAVESVADNEALADLMNSKCIGGELWLTKYYDPSNTYQGNDGNVYKSVNKNLYGYAPKLKPELMEGTPAQVSTPFGNATVADAPADAGGTVPPASAWGKK